MFSFPAQVPYKDGKAVLQVSGCAFLRNEQSLRCTAVMMYHSYFPPFAGPAAAL